MSENEPGYGQTMHYAIIMQSADEVRDLENAPALSMASYLVASQQEQLLTKISVYGERGESRDAMRLLYMNVAALSVWTAMGKTIAVRGARHRPPHSATLLFGVPYSN
jgi:hypothetical protein